MNMKVSKESMSWYEKTNDLLTANNIAVRFSEFAHEEPVIDFKIAQQILKRCWKKYAGFKLGSHVKIKQASGNRYTWIRHGEISINTHKDWGEFIHDLSHLIQTRSSPRKKYIRGSAYHCAAHAILEYKIAVDVIEFVNKKEAA
jgi:hypothetical protein|tara:strand:+ start:263 stop:694 length:432 start_codon:yes stop_codon:yes gene_type:complete